MYYFSITVILCCLYPKKTGKDDGFLSEEVRCATAQDVILQWSASHSHAHGKGREGKTGNTPGNSNRLQPKRRVHVLRINSNFHSSVVSSGRRLEEQKDVIESKNFSDDYSVLSSFLSKEVLNSGRTLLFYSPDRFAHNGLLQLSRATFTH